MITPIYECPNCQKPAFSVSGAIPGKYLVGTCLYCEKSGILPVDQQPVDQSKWNEEETGEGTK